MANVFRISLLLIALLSVGCQQSDAPQQASTEPTTENIVAPVADAPVAQLPDDVRPESYTLDFHIVPDDTHFDGQARIEIELTRDLDRFWLHGLDLEVSRAVIIAGGKRINAEYSEHGNQGVAQLVLAETAAAGPASLEIEYRAPFNEKLVGLYKVVEGEHSYAFSQMEAIDARRAFPGFDEPRFKTPYNLSITTKNEYRAFTNAMAVSEVELDDGLKKITYAQTPPLPTYLIAFTVGPVDVVEWEPIPATEFRDQPLQLRGIAAHGKGEQLQYALEHTAGIFSTLENYFGIAYPYDKLDIVAAPDFEAGAMENAGLIIYRESLLLLDENPSLQQQRAYASVHAHELAHQWFGDLVTMPWWDDIWLNEAFATWMGHKAVDQWNPEYHYDRNMQQRALGAMTSDSLLSARQIREPVNSNAEIDSAFDGITYSKGGGVLSMFETWLGEEAFREGIRGHLKRFAHGNATVFDFIESLSRVAPNKDVDSAFKSFLFQPGVPFVSVSIDCSGPTAKATLSQQRYLPLGTEDEPHSWQVPVCMSYAVDDQLREQCVLLDAPEKTVDLGSSLTCPEWIMPNRNGAGYYRFALEEKAMQGLVAAADEHLNTREKIALADSMEAAMNNGSLDAAVFLQAVPDLVAARERAVALAPLDPIEQIHDDLLSPENQLKAQAWARRLYGDRLEKLANPAASESEMEAKLMRTDLLEFLALTAQDSAIRDQLEQSGQAYLGWGGDGELHADAVEPELLSVAMQVAGEQADAAFFEHLLKHLKASESALTRRAILSGLARVRNPELLPQVHALVFDDAIRSNELPRLLFGAMVQHNQKATLQWFQANLDRLIEHLPPGYANFMPFMGTEFCDREYATALRSMFEPKMEKIPGAKRALDQASGRIGQCAALKDKQAASANSFFAEMETASR